MSEAMNQSRDQSGRAPLVERCGAGQWGAPGRSWSVAMTDEIDQQLRQHLIRADGQEDICLALYRTSTGAHRDSALIFGVVLPLERERALHGNASFTGEYLLRAAGLAAEHDAGLALLHSHPRGVVWQRLSADDRTAEADHSIAAIELTGLPLLGLTLAGDSGVYSARFWPDRAGNEQAVPEWARTVRIVGPRFRIFYDPDLAPSPQPNPRLLRTTHAWGAPVQADLARIRVGIIGAGSVAELVGEALVRTGIANVDVLDFDVVKEHNLDRLLFATDNDIGTSKAELLSNWLRRHAVAERVHISFADLSLVEPDGWARALDCDVLFSCVDRPWPRFAANVAAYSHLVPVVDGGVSVDVDDLGCRGAEWRAHLCAPGRPCMECLGQYDPADVGIERAGKLDDPRYINTLPADHRLRTRENVFAFSMACAGAEVLELLRAVVGPAGQYDVGAITAHWATGTVDRNPDECRPRCPFTNDLLARGDSIDIAVTGRHPTAEVARASRVTRSSGSTSENRNRWWREALARLRLVQGRRGAPR